MSVAIVLLLVLAALLLPAHESGGVELPSGASTEALRTWYITLSYPIKALSSPFVKPPSP